MRLTPNRVSQIAQRAEDLDRAVAFYRDTLGVRFMARFDPPGMAFFDLGNTRLLLEKGASPALLYLEVDDIVASHASLAADGVEFVDEPHLIYHDEQGQFGPAGHELWMTFFRDSEQNMLALTQPRLPG